jgi:hypothetical protein
MCVTSCDIAQKRDIATTPKNGQRELLFYKHLLNYSTKRCI